MRREPPGGNARLVPLPGAIVAAAAYLLAAVLLTWPLASRPGAALFADFGDARGVAWFVWAKANGFLDRPVNPLIAAPSGVPHTATASEPLFEGMLVMLAKASDEIVAINVMAMLAFALSALSAYALLRHLRVARLPAWVGGFAFGFSPAAVMQVTGGHLAYALNVFVPLFLLALWRNSERRSLASAALVAASFTAIALTALYTAYFAAWMALFIAGRDAVTCAPAERRRLVANYLLCALLTVAFVLPFEWSALRTQAAVAAGTAAGPRRVMDLHQLDVFSARPWDYLLPSIDHPWLGPWVEPFARLHLHGSNLFEQTLYLGLVPLGLVAGGLLLRRRMPPPERDAFTLAVLAAAWMFLVSLPPAIGPGLPTPGALGYALAPMFRVYARAGLFVSLFVAMGAAIVLGLAMRRVRPAAGVAMALAAFLAIAFELRSIPPVRADARVPPPVYAWLARQPGDPVVAEYPIVSVDEAAHYDYLFWQRLHHKRLVNGADPCNAAAWALHERVKDLGAAATPGALRDAHVAYVIVHRGKYAEGPIPAPIKRYYPPERAALRLPGEVPGVPRGFRQVAAFGDDVVLEPAPQEPGG
jgi:hypothetical protein